MAEFDILWSMGIDEVGCIFDAGIKSGAIEARGSHYYMNDEKLGQGRETVIDSLRKDEAKLRFVFASHSLLCRARK